MELSTTNSDRKWARVTAIFNILSSYYVHNYVRLHQAIQNLQDVWNVGEADISHVFFSTTIFSF